jgi:hypothetical protein
MAGNAQEIVLALGKDDGLPSKYRSLMVDARLLLSHFQSWTANFMIREGNETTDKLAQLAVTQHIYQVWVDTCPSCLFRIVREEQSDFINL